MKTLLTILALFPLLLTAQYSTPGTGVHWNLDSLVLHSGGVVLAGFNDYIITEDLTISDNDTLTILSYTTLLAPDVLLTIVGYTTIGGTDPIVESSNPDLPYEGIRIEAIGGASFDSVLFNGGGGIKSISGNVEFTSCDFIGIQHLATSNGAIELSNGTVEIQYCLFQDCLGAAISSGANSNCGVEIFDCSFIGNNTENTNRPQINLGSSGSEHSIVIIGNEIVGNPDLDMVGGIATTSLFGEPSDILISNNDISNNRYGITVSGGNTDSRIFGNTIEDNNTQGEPLLGGSGINLNGPASNEAMIESNDIRGNLWGVTVQGEFTVDMGILGNKLGSMGLNVFSDNGNGGQVYALFNNTPNPIDAENNCWIEGQLSTIAEVEDVISHQVDDSELGLVNFSNHLCATPDGVAEFDGASLLVYPNPSTDYLQIIDLPLEALTSYSIFNNLGELIVDASRLINNRIDIQELSQGQYILQIQSDAHLTHSPFVKH